MTLKYYYLADFIYLFIYLFPFKQAAFITNAYQCVAASGDASCVISFWKSKTAIWPALSRLAKGLLGIPATSTSSERAFSLAGRTLEERRTQLSPHTVDGLLFIHGLK